MSAFGRALLAILVSLPPGTFRSLDAFVDHLTEASRRPADAMAAQLPTIAEQARSAPGDPNVPLRGRSWDKLTFTSENETAVDVSCFDLVAIIPPLLDPGPVRLVHVRPRPAVSALQAHRTPRDVVIATCEFLI